MKGIVMFEDQLARIETEFKTPLQWEKESGIRPRNRHHYLNAGFTEDSRVTRALWWSSIETKTCYFPPKEDLLEWCKTAEIPDPFE